MTGELCLQRQSDRRLEAVIATLSSGLRPGRDGAGPIEALIDGAIGRIDASHGDMPRGRYHAAADDARARSSCSTISASSAREVGLIDRRGRR